MSINKVTAKSLLEDNFHIENSVVIREISALDRDPRTISRGDFTQHFPGLDKKQVKREIFFPITAPILTFSCSTKLVAECIMTLEKTVNQDTSSSATQKEDKDPSSSNNNSTLTRSR